MWARPSSRRQTRNRRRRRCTNEAQTEACVAKTIEAFGQPDIFVSNAGIQIVALIDQFEFAKWKQLLAIHLDGAFLNPC